MEHAVSHVERDGAIYWVEARPLVPMTFHGGIRENRRWVGHFAPFALYVSTITEEPTIEPRGPAPKPQRVPSSTIKAGLVKKPSDSGTSSR
jgi:hypothetical protein